MKNIKYLSVCSGIEAATVAWHSLGWEAAGYSEIEKFPSEVLKHHYPEVTNFGDMTKYKEWNLGTIELLVGGTPYQSFSVAGLRKGLEDPRGNLMLTYCGLLDHFKPKWFVWENVPGVLSSAGGRDFGSFLGAVAELGYGWAYRVLDAQYFGVAQRRRRVFVVGCLGDWESAAKVLFEPESLSGNPPPSRKQRQETAATITARFGASRNNHEECVVYNPDPANCLQTTSHEWSRADGFNMVAYENHRRDARVKLMGEVCQTITSAWGTGGGNTPFVQAFNITFCDANGTRKDRENGGLYVNKTDTSNTLTRAGVGTNVVQAFDTYNHTLSDVNQTIKSPQGGVNESVGTVVVHGTQDPCVSDIAFAQGRNNGGDGNGTGPTVVQPIGFEANMSLQQPSTGGVFQTLTRCTHPSVNVNMAVRRLTPVECERLQGFPDNYTDIKPRDKATPDGLRYKALGNSMAVPVMAWIGKRIQMVENQQNI